MFTTIASTLRLALVTLVATSGVYVVLVFALAQLLFPHAANGSLVEHDGRVVGARLVAQAFDAPHFVHPRPSAVGYAAHAAGGSNLSPAGEPFAELARARVAAWSAVSTAPVPAELVTASGSGLDPHLTLAAALYQAPRVAEARGVDVEAVRSVMLEATGKGKPDAADLLEVLALNLRLERDFPLRD